MHSLLASQHTQVRTGAPRQAHAWPYCGFLRPCRGRPDGRVASYRKPPQRRVASTSALYRKRAPAPCMTVSWPSWPCRKTPQLANPPFCHNTPLCIAIQCPSACQLVIHLILQYKPSQPILPKDQNIGKHGYIGNWILRKYRKYW